MDEKLEKRMRDLRLKLTGFVGGMKKRGFQKKPKHNRRKVHRSTGRRR